MCNFNVKEPLVGILLLPQDIEAELNFCLITVGQKNGYTFHLSFLELVYINSYKLQHALFAPDVN